MSSEYLLNLKRIGAESNVPVKKIKQELIDDQSLPSNDLISNLCSSIIESRNANESNKNLVKEEDESWQTELRELIYNGSAMIEDYLTDSESPLKWVVKHGIRLAIMCTQCTLLEQSETSQFVQDHGLLCNKRYIEPIDFIPRVLKVTELKIEDIPEFVYKEPNQVALRKSLERESSLLTNLTDKTRNIPLKFIVSRKNTKRGGICINCGDIFLSTDFKKWNHECWFEENEYNGFCINEVEYNNLLDCPVDEAAAKNPELLNFIIGHFVPTKANSKEWAYWIWDRFTRGELKEQLIYTNTDYPLVYLVNMKKTIVAYTCKRCKRIFPLKTTHLSQSNHIQLCEVYHDILRSGKKANELENTSTNVHSNPNSELKKDDISKADSISKHQICMDKRIRSKRAYLLKRMNKGTSYNINLEKLMVNALTSDVLPTNIFYLNGMKTFFNKLLKIGFELGREPNITLPTYEELLPSCDAIESSLHTFTNIDKFKDQFERVKSIFRSGGGSIAIELIDDSSLNGQLFSISLTFMEDWIAKRLVCNIYSFNEAGLSLNQYINETLKQMNISPNMCYLFTDRKNQTSADNFLLQSSCFGSFLSDLMLNVMSDTSISNLSDADRVRIVELKQILELIQPCLAFLLKNCNIPEDVRTILRCESNSKWFTEALYVEKLLILTRNYFEIIVECVEKASGDLNEKQKVLDLMCKTREQFESLRSYKELVQIFIYHLEPFVVLHHASIHLIVLKFNVIREHLKRQLDMSNNIFYCQICTLALNALDSSEFKFLTDIHFMSTLLAPGHRNQLYNFYSDEKIAYYKDQLLRAINLSQIERLNDEILNTLKQEFERFFDIKGALNTEPLEWWASNEHNFPYISIFASRLFSVPAVGSYADKMLPPFLKDAKLTDSLRKRVLFNWVSESILQLKR